MSNFGARLVFAAAILALLGSAWAGSAGACPEAGYSSYTFKTLIGDTIDRALANRNSNLSEDVYPAGLNDSDVNATTSPLRGVVQGTARIADPLYRIGAGQMCGLDDYQIVDDQAISAVYSEEQSFWVGSQPNGVAYNQGSGGVAANYSAMAYSAKFTGNDYGIPVCTGDLNYSTPDDYTSCDSLSNGRTAMHRMNIRFMGSNWMITDMAAAFTPLASGTAVVGGGRIRLAKELAYGIIGPGQMVESGDVRIELTDISVASDAHPAILNIYMNGTLQGQIQVAPGVTYTFTSSASHESVKVHVYKTAPGFTIASKWTELSIYGAEITLQDGMVYNLQSVSGVDKNFRVSLLWKNSGYNVLAGNTSTNPDSLREIALYDIDGFGTMATKGAALSFIGSVPAFNATYDGVDLADSEYANLAYTALPAADYEVATRPGNTACEVDRCYGYAEIHVGQEIGTGALRARLSDISVATGPNSGHPAIFDILDASNQTIGQIEVTPGTNFTYTSSITGDVIVVDVCQTKPGFTLDSKWAMANVAYPAIPCYGYTNTTVGQTIGTGTLLARLSDISIASPSPYPAIVDVLENGTRVGQVSVTPGVKYTYVSSVTGSTIVFDVCQTNPGFTLDSKWALMKVKYSTNSLYSGAKMMKIATDGSVQFGTNISGVLPEGVYTDTVYYDPVGLTTTGDTLNGTYNQPADQSAWSPKIFWKNDGGCYNWNYAINATANADHPYMAYLPAANTGSDYQMSGLFFSADNHTGLPQGTGRIFYNEFAGSIGGGSSAWDTAALTFTSDPAKETLEFTPNTIYYRSIGASQNFVSYAAPGFVTERGSKIVSVGSTNAAMQVATRIGQPSFSIGLGFNYTVAENNQASSLERQLVHLNQGWNIVSFYLTPENNSTAHIFGPMAGKIASVWYYENGIWQNYQPGVGGTLDAVKDGRAYFVNATVPAFLEVNGTQRKLIQNTPPQPPAEPFLVSIYTGWNLLGVYADPMQYASPTIGQITGGRTGNFYTYDGMYHRVTGDTAIPLGGGFWMYSTQNDTYAPLT